MNTSWENSQGQSLNEAVLLALNTLDRSQREQAIERAAEAVDPEQLVGLISTDDAIGRNAALEALTRGGRRSVPALVRALADPDPEVVMFAASTLGKTRDPTAIPHLAGVLRHSDPNVCQAAVESLGALRAVSTLGALGELLAGDAWIRFSVVHTLGEIGDPSSAPTLIALLGDKQLRDIAISALGKIGGTEVVGELVQRLEASASLAEFTLCLEALGRTLAQTPDPAALQALPFWTAFGNRADSTVMPRLTEVLRLVADPEDAGETLAKKEAAIELVRCLRLKSCYSEMIAAAADERLCEPLLFAAADLGIVLVPHLTVALSHANRPVRQFACRAMAAVSFERGGAAVTSLLTDPDDAIRAVALRVMSRLHYTEGLVNMVGRLADESGAVRAAAAEALARMDARVVTIALLRNAEVLSQQHLLVLSIMQANPHALQRGFVETSLGNPDERVRQAAVATLAAQRGPDLVDALEPMLADGSVEVRRGVVAALTDRPSERTRLLLLGLLERDPETRCDVLRVLGRFGDERVVPKIIGIFRSCTAVEQACAIEALGALESPSVEPFLVRQLAHRDPQVRRHAVRALAQIGSTSALRRLGVALRDGHPKVRMAVAKALASCPHPIARRALEYLSLDSVASVAAAARAHLG